MGSLQGAMIEYRKQLEKGMIQQAYRGLMDYMAGLRTYFQTRNPDFFVSGSIYYGYMDMSYFSFFPRVLKDRNLKVAVVFVHPRWRFEVWLAGYNKQAQAKYWKVFKDSGWDQYHLVPTIKGADSILEGVLVAEPDFSDLDGMTKQIEAGTLKFIADVEQALVVEKL